MSRPHDWPQRLNRYLVETGKRITESQDPDWGTLDCATFAAGAVEAVCGEDPMADLRGRYEAKTGAFRLLGELGDGDLRAAVTERLGPEIHPSRAHQGDVALFEDALGVVCGRYALFLGPGGYSKIPTLRCECAWKVAR